MRIVNWRRSLEQKWPGLRFGQIKVETARGKHVFEVELQLNELNPNAVRVELYADGNNDHASVRKEMTRIRQLTGPANGCVYRAAMPAIRPATDYTPRLVPQCSGVAVPLEAGQILWQK
jgi:starch phosphorylase